MKQILLRVPDEVHRRLTERARRDGRSVNALAGELLDLGASADEGGRRGRLRARAAAAGLSATVEAEATEAPDRESLAVQTRGWGAVAGDLLAQERDRV